jgi:hypothetical protein
MASAEVFGKQGIPETKKRGMADHSPFFEYGFFWGVRGR